MPMRIHTFWSARWPLLLLIVVLFCEAGWLVYIAPTDVTHYACYGVTFWLGGSGTSLLPPAWCAFLPSASLASPLHMLPLEYPPLTLVAFSLPLLAPLPYYTLSFALLMSLVVAVIYWLLAQTDFPQAAPVFLLYLLLGAVVVAQERFDLLPALCTLVCLLAATRDRWTTAYIALALGVLLKFYPIVMLPALFLAEQRAYSVQKELTALSTSWVRRTWREVQRWRWRNSLLAVVLIVLVMGAFALLNFNDAILSPLSYFLQRPPQIESLASSFIWVASHAGVSYRIDFSFGSLNLESSTVRLISPVETLLTLVGLLGVYWLQGRRSIDLAQALVALVCVLIVTGKVFSPQYLIWLFPLLAYSFASGRIGRLWMYGWAAISLLTTFIYLFYYSHLANVSTAPTIVQTLPGFFAVVALRNLLLACVVLAFFANWWHVRSGASTYKLAGSGGAQIPIHGCGNGNR